MFRKFRNLVKNVAQAVVQVAMYAIRQTVEYLEGVHQKLRVGNYGGRVDVPMDELCVSD